MRTWFSRTWGQIAAATADRGRGLRGRGGRGRGARAATTTAATSAEATSAASSHGIDLPMNLSRASGEVRHFEQVNANRNVPDQRARAKRPGPKGLDHRAWTKGPRPRSQDLDQGAGRWTCPPLVCHCFPADTFGLENCSGRGEPNPPQCRPNPGVGLGWDWGLFLCDCDSGDHLTNAVT